MDILKICKLDGEDAICQLANIGFWIQHTLIPLIVILNPFLHKMPVLLKLSDFSHILSWLFGSKKNYVELGKCLFNNYLAQTDPPYVNKRLLKVYCCKQQQWCGLVAAASCGIVAACEFFVCKLVLLLLVAATLQLLVAATLWLLVAATLQLLVAATLRLLVAATLRLLVAATLQLFVCRECVGLVVDYF